VAVTGLGWTPLELLADSAFLQPVALLADRQFRDDTGAGAKGVDVQPQLGQTARNMTRLIAFRRAVLERKRPSLQPSC
jgi:hypothetical protein